MADENSKNPAGPNDPGAYLALGIVSAAALAISVFTSGAALAFFLGCGAAAGFMSYNLYKAEKSKTDPVFDAERNPNFQSMDQPRLPEPHVNLTPELGAAQEMPSDKNAVKLAASQGSSRGVWSR